MNRGRVAKLLALAAIVAVAAYLRFDAIGGPSYWLDEILGDHLTSVAASQPWWRWLTGLEREHGPLYYAVQLVTRLFGRGEAAGRAPSALFGIVTVAVVWCAANRSRGAGFAASLLLAVSPLHVYYSREARPYALVMLLTAALIVALLRDAPRATIVTLIALLYTSAVAAPVVLAAAALLVCVAAVTRERRHLLVALSAVAVAALFALLYRGTPSANTAATFPPLDAKFFATLARTFTVSAAGVAGDERTAVLLLVAAFAGAVILMLRERRAGAIVIAMTILPVAISITSLWWFDHWYAARYVAAGLIGFLMLAGYGIAALAELIAWPFVRRAPRLASAIAIASAVIFAALVAKGSWRVARYEPFQKLDWRAIAAVMRTHIGPRDTIIAAESWSDVSLRYYLRGLPSTVRFIGATSLPTAERLVAQHYEKTWLVTSGFAADTSVRDWTCNYPLLLASPIDSFRLHYVPSAADFLTSRAGAAEVRAASAALGARGVTLHLDDATLLGSGWADAEGPGRDAFRWAVGTSATLSLPRGPAVDRVIRFNAQPFDHPSLPPQRMQVLVNGRLAGTETMPPGWRDYAISAPAALWREDVNVLTFVFARAAAPASLDRHASDTRALAAAFDSISINDADAPAPADPPRRLLPMIRAGAGVLLDADTSWRGAKTRFPHQRLRRETIEPLLGRLGLDPLTVWPRLASGEVPLDSVIELIAYGSDCESDREFLRRAFEVILERPPSADEERGLLADLRTRWKRPRVARQIALSEEFLTRALQ